MLPNLGKYWDDPCFDMLVISLFSFHAFSLFSIQGFNSFTLSPLRQAAVRRSCIYTLCTAYY